MESQKSHKLRKFRELAVEEKERLIKSALQKKPEGIVVIVQAHPRCKIFNELPEFKYVVCKKDNVREIDTKIKNKIGESDKKLANQSVFLFTQNKVVTRGKFKIIPDTTFEDLYSKHKNFKDGVLYLYFANVDSF